MKKLLPLLLSCLLFAGCGLPADLPAPPAEQAWEDFGGAVQIPALNLPQVQGMLCFEEQLLLLCGEQTTTLHLLDPQTLEQTASAALSCLVAQEDLVSTGNGTLCFYDPEERAAVVLDGSLQVLRRLALPPAVRGKAILQGNTLFYCTGSEVRAWDLETDRHRRVKEMAYDSQSLTAVLMNGSVLQCLVTEGTKTQTLFLSAADGHLLQQVPGRCRLVTQGSFFYASLFPEGPPLYLLGQTSPQLLMPRDWTAACFFLPGCHGAVTASESLLEYYDLTTGLRRHSLSLEVPRAIVGLQDAAAILTQEGQLLLWDLSPGSPAAVEDETCYIHPYQPAGAQDLARCEALARELENRHGLAIRLDPPHSAAAAETLAPRLLRALEDLDRQLSRLPEGLLAQTAGTFSSFTLCLVRSCSEGCGRFFLEGADAWVLVPAGETAYHGLFHAMEVRIFGNSHALDRWDQLNPAGFQYDYDYASNARRDSGVYLVRESRAFADTFSMSYPREDRARLFEAAMDETQAPLFQPEQMRRKLQTLCQGIRESYQLSAYPWERALE